jgi:hypothetical protein
MDHADQIINLVELILKHLDECNQRTNSQCQRRPKSDVALRGRG